MSESPQAENPSRIDELVQKLITKSSPKIVATRRRRDQNILEEQAPMEKPPRIRKIVVCPIPRRLANLNSPRQGVCTSPKLQPVTIDSSDSENEWAFPERYGPRIERKKCKTLSVPCKKQGEPRNSETKGILKKFRSRTTQWKKMLEWEFWNTSEEDTKNVQRALPGKSLKVQLIDLVTATKIRSALNAGDHPAKVAHNLENRTKIRSALNGGDGSAEVPPNLEKNPSKNEKTSKKVKAVQRKRKKSKKSKGIEVKVTVKKGYGWAQCLLRILDHSLRTNNETMRLKTLDYIAPVTYLLLNTEEFFRLSPAGLKLILARDDLMIACELDLFNAVTSWGLYNCYGRNHRGFIGPGHYYDVMLEILKGPLNLARFSHLTNYNLLFKAIPFLHTSYDSLQNRLAWFKGMLRHSKGTSGIIKYFHEEAPPMPPKKSLMDMVTSLFELQFVGPPKKIYVGRGGYFYLDYSIEEWKQLTLLYVLRLIPPFVSHIVVLCQDDGKVMALANLGSEISRQVYAVQNKSDENDRTADTNRFCACGGVLITPDACWEIDSSNISIVVVYDVPTSKMKNGQQLGLRKILGQNKVVIYFMKCINYPKLADFILKDIPWINLSKLPVNFEFE